MTLSGDRRSRWKGQTRLHPSLLPSPGRRPRHPFCCRPSSFLLSEGISLCLVWPPCLSLSMDDCQRVLSKHTAAARPNSWGGGSSPHIRRLAAGLPSPPGPQLCERNARGAGVLQPRAHAHGDQRLRAREEPEVRSQTGSSSHTCSRQDLGVLPSSSPASGLDVLICEMERLNSVGSMTHTLRQRWGLWTNSPILRGPRASWITGVRQ